MYSLKNIVQKQQCFIQEVIDETLAIETKIPKTLDLGTKTRIYSLNLGIQDHVISASVFIRN